MVEQRMSSRSQWPAPFRLMVSCPSERGCTMRLMMPMPYHLCRESVAISQALIAPARIGLSAGTFIRLRREKCVSQPVKLHCLKMY